MKSKWMGDSYIDISEMARTQKLEYWPKQLYYEQAWIRAFNIWEFIVSQILSLFGSLAVSAVGAKKLISLKITEERVELHFPWKTLQIFPNEIRAWNEEVQKHNKVKPLLDLSGDRMLKIKLSSGKDIFIRSDKVSEIEKALKALTKTKP